MSYIKHYNNNYYSFMERRYSDISWLIIYPIVTSTVQHNAQYY